ncbi:MAG: aminodeoxychorismate synthase, component I [Candidatus Hydrogenedentota bacterium]
MPTREIVDAPTCSRVTSIVISSLTARFGGDNYHSPVSIFRADSTGDVLPLLTEVGLAVEGGLHAVGFISYEASPAFDSALMCHPPIGFPLAWFALFEGPAKDSRDDCEYSVGSWQTLVDRESYNESISALRNRIAAGDTYQVNHTFPLEASFKGDPLPWFKTVAQAQESNHAAFIDTGRFQIASFSPELFFRLENGILTTRPMKGTRPRGRWPEEDERMARDLAESEKDRAENVMIVDLLRSDMGRISESGSVEVKSLFDVERYPTVWQMTSTIQSRTTASVPEIFRALFPSGSVTGAPKVETMKIIREHEMYPRGVYCGAIGRWLPGGFAEFSVAIRTAVIDSEKGIARYSVGSGITWDSSADAEYDECLQKAKALTQPPMRASLLETLAFNGRFSYLDEHLDRMARSANYFGFTFDPQRIQTTLENARIGANPARVRLILSPEGAPSLEWETLTPLPAILRVALAPVPVDSRDRMLFHKTTDRDLYTTARNARADYDDAILWNERGEVTESTMANIVVQIDGKKYTPAVECGLLPGIFRAMILKAGVVSERAIHVDELRRAQGIWLVNSVRGWMTATLETPGQG